MSSFKETIASIGDDRTSVKSSLYKCRDDKSKLTSAVDDLYNDIRKCERQLNRTYRKHVRANECAKQTMKDIGDFKIYPRGVRNGNFQLYTPEGERFILEKPAEGNLYQQYLISNSSGNHLRIYSVV